MKKADNINKSELNVKAMGNVSGGTGPLGAVGPVNGTGPLGAVGPVNGTGPLGAVGPVNETGPLGTCDPPKGTGPLGAVGPVKDWRRQSSQEIDSPVAVGLAKQPYTRGDIQ